MNRGVCGSCAVKKGGIDVDPQQTMAEAFIRAWDREEKTSLTFASVEDSGYALAVQHQSCITVAARLVMDERGYRMFTRATSQDLDNAMRSAHV